MGFLVRFIENIRFTVRKREKLWIYLSVILAILLLSVRIHILATAPAIRYAKYAQSAVMVSPSDSSSDCKSKDTLATTL